MRIVDQDTREVLTDLRDVLDLNPRPRKGDHIIVNESIYEFVRVEYEIVDSSTGKYILRYIVAPAPWGKKRFKELRGRR